MTVKDFLILIPILLPFPIYGRRVSRAIISFVDGYLVVGTLVGERVGSSVGTLVGLIATA